MDKLQCEQNCIHCPVCGHKEQFKKYFEEHIALREKSILFDSQPTCKFYLNKDDIEIKHTHDISDIYKRVKEVTGKEPIVFGSRDDLNKLHNRVSEFEKLTCKTPKKDLTTVNPIINKSEDECTVTKDDELTTIEEILNSIYGSNVIIRF